MFQAAPFPPLLDSAVDAVPLGLLGALLGLDVVSFPQAMVSRPLSVHPPTRRSSTALLARKRRPLPNGRS